MFNETVASWVWWGSRLTTTTTVFELPVPVASLGSATDFEYAITDSWSVWWKWRSRNW